LYIRAQLKNHRLLRDLTEDYLKEAPTNHLDKEESQGKHLATLALTVFNEHVAITERISKELAGGENK
jgi:putative membrane protein